MDPIRRWSLEGAIVAIVLIGFAVDLFAGSVARPTPAPVEGRRFVERAVFCPPSMPDTRTTVAAAPISDERVSVGVEPTRPEEQDLAAGHILVQPLTEDRPADVVGFGAPVVAGAIVRSHEPIEGEAAASCSPTAASKWYFGAGASTLGADQRLLIYNPFPDEAVVRVYFATPEGENVRPALSDIPVPAKSAAFVRVNRFVHLERSLATIVETRRGRVVAWRALFDQPERGPSGLQLSLGVTSPSPTWYFPEGDIAEQAQESIGVMNPDPDTEATITVSLVTGDRVVQPPSLVEISIPPMSSRVFPVRSTLPRRQKELGGATAIVQSTNDVPVVAERTVRYSKEGRQGVTSEIGIPRLRRDWVLLPATLEPTSDAVLVVNPGPEEISVDLTLLRPDGRPLSPRRLSQRQLGPGGRLRIGITERTRGETVIVLVRASGDIGVERLSYSSARDDVGSVMGVWAGN